MPFPVGLLQTVATPPWWPRYTVLEDAVCLRHPTLANAVPVPVQAADPRQQEPIAITGANDVAVM